MTRQYLAGLVLTGLAFGGFIACNNDPPDDRPENAAPVAESISAESTSLDPNQSVELTLNAFDPDFANQDAGLTANSPQGTAGDAGTSGGMQMGVTHTVVWTVSNSKWSIEGNGLTATLTAPGEYESETNIKAVIKDIDRPDDLQASASTSASTGENVRPSISGIEATPSPVTPNGTVALKAEAQDPIDDLDYSWKIESDDNWNLGSNSGAEVSLFAPDTDDSSVQVTVEVSDGYGLSDSLQTSIRTTENRPPSISSVTANPPQVQRGGTSTITVSAADPDNNELSYNWSTPGDWSISGAGPEVDVTAPQEYGVSGTFTVTVTDSRGASSEASIVVSTQANNGPVISSVTAQPQQVDAGGSIDMSVIASHPENDDLSYDWSVSDPGTWSVAPAGDAATVNAPNSPGTVTRVQVTVTDPQGKEATAATTVSTAPNQSPNIGSVTANPATFEPTNYTDVTASVTDPNGDDLTYNWTVSSPFQINGGGETVRVTAPQQYGLSAVVKVTVTDEFGAKSTGRAAIATANNSPPTISSVNANPSTVSKNGTAELTVTASDPNGNSLTYAWSGPGGNWSMNSTSGETISITAPDQYSASGTFTVTVSDGFGGSTTGSVVVNTGQNQAPSINGISANPTGAVEPGGTKTLTVSASDPNGDPISYSWGPVPGNWSAGGTTNPTITLTAPDSYGETAVLNLDVTDAPGLTTSTTYFLETEQNDAPILLDALQLDPSSINCTTTSTADVRAYDPNGDTLNYSWSLSNTSDFNIASTSGDEATIEMTSSASAGSSSTDVTVTVDDGYGMSVSDTKTLSGTAPPTGCP